MIRLEKGSRYQVQKNTYVTLDYDDITHRIYNNLPLFDEEEASDLVDVSKLPLLEDEIAVNVETKHHYLTNLGRVYNAKSKKFISATRKLNSIYYNVSQTSVILKREMEKQGWTYNPDVIDKFLNEQGINCKHLK
jgi:hypothetical protein